MILHSISKNSCHPLCLILETIVTIIRCLWMELNETNSGDLFKCDPVSEIDKKKDIRSESRLETTFRYIEFLISGGGHRWR